MNLIAAIMTWTESVMGNLGFPSRWRNALEVKTGSRLKTIRFADQHLFWNARKIVDADLDLMELVTRGRYRRRTRRRPDDVLIGVSIGKLLHRRDTSPR
jgi:hypothetical protein